jgi:hypothetical protein
MMNTPQTASIRYAAHQAVEGVDFADQSSPSSEKSMPATRWHRRRRTAPCPTIDREEDDRQGGGEQQHQRAFELLRIDQSAENTAAK